jgi:hypothetical protein
MVIGKSAMNAYEPLSAILRIPLKEYVLPSDRPTGR